MIELNCDSLKHLQSEINNWGPKRSRGQDVVPGLHYGFDLLKETGKKLVRKLKISELILVPMWQKSILNSLMQLIF